MSFSDFRAQFPAADTSAWFATPGCCPGASPVADAMGAAVRQWRDGSFDWLKWEEAAERARTKFAALLGADAESVALMPSLAEAAATVAASVPAGSNVVVYSGEFRSNLLPWLALRGRGVHVSLVPETDGLTDALVTAVSEGAFLVAVSHVQSATGARIDLDALCCAAESAGTRVFLNTTQSSGVLPTRARNGLHYIACHGYKWLLAPRGAAFLYAMPQFQNELSPLAPSWKSVDNPADNMYGASPIFSRTMSKLDGSLSWLTWVGAQAALELVTSLSCREVEKYCVELASDLRRQLISEGLSVGSTDVPSHIISVRNHEPAKAVASLADAGVVVTARGCNLRLGIHAFNVAADVEAACRALRGLR